MKVVKCRRGGPRSSLAHYVTRKVWCLFPFAYVGAEWLFLDIQRVRKVIVRLRLCSNVIPGNSLRNHKRGPCSCLAIKLSVLMFAKKREADISSTSYRETHFMRPECTTAYTHFSNVLYILYVFAYLTVLDRLLETYACRSIPDHIINTVQHKNILLKLCI